MRGFPRLALHPSPSAHLWPRSLAAPRSRSVDMALRGPFVTATRPSPPSSSPSPTRARLSRSGSCGCARTAAADGGCEGIEEKERMRGRGRDRKRRGEDGGGRKDWLGRGGRNRRVDGSSPIDLRGSSQIKSRDPQGKLEQIVADPARVEGWQTSLSP
eukprot:9472087-Pyramimonas_sp.AAC.1